MSTEIPVAGAELTDEQRAYLLADAAGAQAAMQSAPRGPLLPAEQDIDNVMEQLRQQSAQLAAVQAQMLAMGRQIEEAQAAQGGPLTVRYAQGAADKIEALAQAHPNNPLGSAHFTDARDAAGRLVAAAAMASKGTGPVQLVRDAAADIERFAARVHRRLGGMHVDWSAILDDAELAVSEAVKLAA